MNPNIATAIIAGVASIVVALTTTVGTLYSTESNLTKANEKAERLIRQSSFLPIGTIIPSILDTTEFAKGVGDPNNFDSTKSAWAPADGQLIIKQSKYGKLFNVETTPDLRSMFLRGLNAFDPTKPREDEFTDPEQVAKAGRTQKHSFDSHNHDVVKKDGSLSLVLASFSYKGKGNNSFVSHYRYGAEKTYAAPEDKDVWYAKEKGGVETRPNNIGVYYYIKIN